MATPPSSQPTVDEDDATVAQGPAHTGAGTEPDDPEALPRTLGRYVIVGELGVGGMGRVFRACDPELDREVAVKLLRRVTTDARSRLRREAQAMARLCHPNVLPIYDVADDGRHVFIAMELVRGQSVRQWLDAGPRAWQEVVEVLAAAGRGLAAAHEAGIVHRDFKPGNVLRGEDGRVRVMDFGLARGTSESSEGSLATGSSSSWSRGGLDEISSGVGLLGLPSRSLRSTDSQDGLSSFADDLTQVGMVMGTPAYMAPEQHLGRPADARCDQYGFCVTLWEALYGRRPFEAATIADWYQVKTTRAPKSDAGREAPPWLRAVVLRGLASNPGDRFASMPALLYALGQGTRRHRQRRTLMLGLGCVALVGAIGASFYEPEQLCSGADEKLVEIWDRKAATEVERALLATEVSYAPDTWARIEPQLDGYAARWRAAFVDACEATRVRHEQPEALMDARMRCLEDRRRGLRALVRTLRGADPQVVERAVSAVGGLSPIEPCADPGYVQAQALPPTDSQRAAEVEALEEELARIKALEAAGQAKQAEAGALALLERAQAVGYPPLEAWAHFSLGNIRDDLGRFEEGVAGFEQAYFIGEREGLDTVQATAAIMLVHVLASNVGDPNAAEKWARFAEAALERTPDPELEVAYLGNLGLLAMTRNDYPEALALLERTLALREQRLGPDDPAVATALNNVALAHDAMGRLDRAAELHERALAIRERALGPGHPEVGTSLVNLANLDQTLAKLEPALEQLLRAQAIFESAYGSRHPMIAATLVNLGNLYGEMGKPTQALAAYLQAIPIAEETHGPSHPNVVGTFVNIGNAYRSLGQRERAREYFERALERAEKMQGNEVVLAIVLANIGLLAFDRGDMAEAEAHALRGLEVVATTTGMRHPLAATLTGTLAIVRSEQGDHSEALRLQREALAVRREVFGPRHPETAISLAQLGEASLSAGKPADAVAPLEEAVAILAGDGSAAVPESQAQALSEARFSLARAWWDAGGDRAKAWTTARAARNVLQGLEGDHSGVIAEIDQWLAEHDEPRQRRR